MSAPPSARRYTIFPDTVADRLRQADADPAHAGDLLDKDKENKVFLEPTDETAVLYVVRKSSMGAAIKFWMFDDTELLGVTRGKGYFVVQLTPGTHRLWAKAENFDVLDLEVEAGKTYYLQQKVKMGFGKARVGLQPLDESDGQKLIQKLAYVRLTDEGRARGAEIAAEKHSKALAKADG